jgi:hypothetical protein
MEKNAIKNVIDSIEKVFRYLIPGIAFSFLFALSFPSKYETLMGTMPDDIFSRFLLILAIGMSIYVIHSQVIRFTLERIVFALGWSPVNLFTEERNLFARTYIRALASLNLEREKDKDYPRGYYQYLWSMFHYSFILSALLIGFSIWNDADSFVGYHDCLAGAVGIVVLLLSLCTYRYLQLLERETTDLFLRTQQGGVGSRDEKNP